MLHWLQRLLLLLLLYKGRSMDGHLQSNRASSLCSGQLSDVNIWLLAYRHSSNIECCGHICGLELLHPLSWILLDKLRRWLLRKIMKIGWQLAHKMIGIAIIKSIVSRHLILILLILSFKQPALAVRFLTYNGTLYYFFVLKSQPKSEIMKSSLHSPY